MSTIQQPATAPQRAALTRYRAVKNAVVRVEVTLAVILLIALSCVLMFQVFSRYVMHYPFTWTEEVARFIFIWMVFIGAAALASKNAHIAVTFITETVRPSVARWIVRFAALVMTVATGVVAWASFEFVEATATLPSPALGLPMVYVYLAPALSFLLVSLHTIEFIITGEDISLEQEMETAV
ncbi:TRAP transporter small permease [Leucobacter albus]|uniref:TRAP transporter small permease n=1 Tax=Leucobacter albus TaxID=272210 RepID=A0ABW3TSE9_9MICO